MKVNHFLRIAGIHCVFKIFTKSAMNNKESVQNSSEGINDVNKIAVCIEMLVQKYSSIDQELVLERLTKASDLVEEFNQIVNEMNSQTIHDSMNQLIPEYIRDLSGLSALLDLLGDIKAVELDDNDLQAQLDRIKSILPETEYQYECDVLIDRLKVSTNVAMEANLIINEILNDDQNDLARENAKQEFNADDTFAIHVKNELIISHIEPVSVDDGHEIKNESQTIFNCSPASADFVEVQHSNKNATFKEGDAMSNPVLVSATASEKPEAACRNKTPISDRNPSTVKRIQMSAKTFDSSKPGEKNLSTENCASSSAKVDCESVEGNIVRSTLEINLNYKKPVVPFRNKKEMNNVSKITPNEVTPQTSGFDTDALSSSGNCTYIAAETALSKTPLANENVEDTILSTMPVNGNMVKENVVLSEEDEQFFLRLYEMFPDIDPIYLTEIMISEHLDLQDVVEELTLTDYPKLRDRLQLEQRDRRRKILLNKTFTEANLSEMLLTYDNDPKGYFSNIEKGVSDSYKKHAIVLLTAEFPSHQTDVESTLKKNNFHYCPTRNDLLNKFYGQPANFLLKSSLVKLKWPEELDEGFFREVQFATFENVIEKELAAKRAHRVNQIKHAVENSLLIECSTCMNDECLEIDMVFCDSCEHSFCQDCVKTHANIQLAGGSQTVACMDTECASQFSILSLSHIISPQLIDLYWRRKESKSSSGQPDGFEECPFCNFKAIISNENDKIFKCFNPSCLKESCRICKFENHIPMKCSTVESSSNNEAVIRNFIANQMAEAMIRICPNKKCGNRILKESGCNEMTCPCGQKMCYVCKQPIDSARDHFQTLREGNRCPQFSQLFEVNQMEAMRAGHDALKKLNRSDQDQNSDHIVNELVDEPALDDDEYEDEDNGEDALLRLTLVLEQLQSRIQEHLEEQVEAEAAPVAQASLKRAGSKKSKAGCTIQ